MRKVVDPAELEGEELARWYRRTPDEIEAERAQARKGAEAAFYGRDRARSAAIDVQSDSEGQFSEVGAGRSWIQVGPECRHSD